MENKSKALLKRIRMLLLNKFRYKFLKMGEGAYIGKNIYIRPSTVELNDYSYVGPGSYLSINHLVIGRYTMLASHVAVVGGDYFTNKPRMPMCFLGKEFLMKTNQKEVIIGDDVWVGHGAIIMSGVSIGNGSIIGSGSIVTKDIPAYSIAVGNPAKVIKKRFQNGSDIVHHEKMLAKKSAIVYREAYEKFQTGAG
jgi:chloramphenicol O-acetyltransferase type B